MLLALALILLAQAAADRPSVSAEKVESVEAAEPAPAARRAELNLLGASDASSGESRRNENVQFNLIDNNAQKELNIRLGTTATLVRELDPERNYFAAEYGVSPSASLHQPGPKGSGLHGQLFFRHLNSVFSARSFFQVGEVKPARENEFGFGLSLPEWRKTRVQMEASRRLLRGQVNGNVQVPLLSERTPLTTDPAEAAFVSRLLSAYPAQAPNRPDIDPRMLNTNSPQSINGDTADLRVDHELTARDRLMASYQFVGQRVLAFQLIRGQNPDTTTKSHRARLTWAKTISPSTILDVTAGFDRVGVLIVPENNNLGPSIFISGGALTNINGQTQVPIDRAQNEFREGIRVKHLRGRHAFTAGFDVLRRQLNGYDSDNHLGTYSFRANFGNDAITNLRLGRATNYFRGVGVISRGFRNFDLAGYFGDTWRVGPDLTLQLGVRWRPVTRPTEVNGYNELPYGSDWNNVAPQFALAWRAPRGVVRASYSIHHGEIFPATYQQARFNPPWNVKYVINDPDLLRPIPPNVTVGRGVFYDHARELHSPYSQLYGLTYEWEFNRHWSLQTGYVGSRSVGLLLHWYENRAVPVPGVPLVTGTINDRRPDPAILDRRRVVNSGRAAFDAGRVTLNARNWRGLNLEASYWFSKNIDTGADYISTAYDADSFRGMSQSQFDVSKDLRGLSRFDQPHAFLARMTQELPFQLQLGTIVLAKSGTPFLVTTGSDAPGFGNVDGANGDRPNLIDASVLGRTIGNPDTAPRLLPRTAFAFAPPTQGAGTLGRNTFRRGGIYNVNLSLERGFRLRDAELRVRAKSVNFLNTPQFAEPGAALVDPNFGRITNTLNEGRTFRFQAALRF